MRYAQELREGMRESFEAMRKKVRNLYSVIHPTSCSVHPAALVSLFFSNICLPGDIPFFKLFESASVLAFLDIRPLSRGHALVTPKHLGAKITGIPDNQLPDIPPVVSKVAKAIGADNYNVLQNNELAGASGD